jgi:hypothetical protein
MNAERPSLLKSFSDWIATLGEILRNVFAWPVVNDKAEPRQTTDPDFGGWVVNDPMVTLNPASRYGDDATGFLGGSERDSPVRGEKDD